MISSIVTNDSLLAVIGTEVYQFDNTHPNFQLMLEAIKNQDENEFVDLSTKTSEEIIAEYVSNTGIAIENNKVLFNGIELSTGLTRRILEMKSKGFPIDNMVRFLENLLENPSRTSVHELYDFLENSNIPITEDGCFLSYKAVTTHSGPDFTDVHGNTVKSGDLVDKHSRSVRNNIGDSPFLTRNEVDDDRDRQCSFGYHTGGLKYATETFFDSGDTVVITKTNPRDVVAVPKDYDCQKLRTCKYEVVGLFKGALNKAVYSDEDQYEYDVEYENQNQSIDVSELRIGDSISFSYSNEKRFGVVDSLDVSYATLILESSDPSFNGSTQFRKFIKSFMRDIKLI